MTRVTQLLGSSSGTEQRNRQHHGQHQRPRVTNLCVALSAASRSLRCAVSYKNLICAQKSTGIHYEFMVLFPNCLQVCLGSWVCVMRGSVRVTHRSTNSYESHPSAISKLGYGGLVSGRNEHMTGMCRNHLLKILPLTESMRPYVHVHVDGRALALSNNKQSQ